MGSPPGPVAGGAPRVWRASPHIAYVTPSRLATRTAPRHSQIRHVDLGEIFSADAPAAPLIYTQYVSTSNHNIKSRPQGGLQVHASVSNVVALFVRQEHYRLLDLCRRVLLGLLDLRVVLAQDRRVLQRGDGDATRFTWAVWICCRSGDLGARCHGGHCALEPVPRVSSCGLLLVGQLAWPAA